MDKATKILTEISTVTRKIETNYPELQKYLDETQDTLPENGKIDGKLDEKELEKYLNSLKEMIKKYEEEH